jgi:hypothetical protein
MLLLNQRTNQRQKMVTQTPTRITHLVTILIHTLLITRVLHLLRSTFLHWVNHRVGFGHRERKQEAEEHKKEKIRAINMN